ncbi:Myb-like DNA-binding domain-containing protein [Spironucleus salmonicida]|uniref:Myb-like DNA-binding domain-containing protein n=1 Tax=Spironucleus salmonicida TaxID=348837 RepID=V6LBS7_9EUKA|nr:Myb-like DNA-binding domain-containing protein [Spironucleus salmonicida]|eukprot:EST41897.1 Myb-like DNA-binding domain-containing protein [Spironucleus salmonicida]
MPYNKWLPAEKVKLIELLQLQNNRIDWVSISQQIQRSPRQCYDFYRTYLKNEKLPISCGDKQHLWTEEDIDILIREITLRNKFDFEGIQKDFFPQLSPSQLKGKWYHLQRQGKQKINQLSLIFQQVCQQQI